MTGWQRSLWGFALVLASAHCGDSGGDKPGAGQETGPCVDSQCLQGLMCLSNVCVDPDPTGAPTSGGGGGTTGDGEGDVGIGLPCSPYEQDCIADYKCGPQDGSVVCVPKDPDPVEVGEPCTPKKFGDLLTDNCVEGAYCESVGFQENVCVKMCDGPASAPTCPDDATICHAGDAGNKPICRTRCDPLDAICEGTDVCIPSKLGNGFFCFSPYTKLDFGGDCLSGINQCLPGLLCAPADAFAPDTCFGQYGCCTYFCDLDAPACPGQVPNCVPFYAPGEAPAGDEDVGYCSI